MKLTAEIDGTEHSLNLRSEGARVTAEIDGRGYELEARETEAGSYLLLSDEGRVFECRVGGAQSADGPVEVQVGQQLYQITLFDPKRLRHSASAGAQASGRVLASMPGKVVRVLVEMGAQVAAGDALLVVEAMKMQNELKAPKSGTVIELHAIAGQTVNAGDILIVVE
ncbi:MAG: biotin/lipoyl-binding protein [Pyrinomonadaceae bacterium]|jgi:biotin carboxyl carrier protein|nr:biotin/lipoyl-binding protein [Pyrinomonadaceae bacterium]MDQ3586655.1 biotin/lipoyl-binding protein [Acidobacteriota bacterium]